MRAITQKTFGGPEVLELVDDAPKPAPGPTQVLVRVRATSVNPVELFVRSGAFPLLGEPPFVLGWDISGVVEQVDPGVHRFKVGDEVYGMPYFPAAAGANAEYLVAPARQLARKPAGISHEEAAALPLVGLTAWHALVEIAQLRPGQRVLIHGAGGGLGHIAVQLAKHLGAEVVGTASAGKHDFLRGLGADQLIDYRTQDYAEVLQDTPVDVVLETLGSGNAERSFGVLRQGGVLVTAVERTSTTLPELAEQSGVRFAAVGVEPDPAGLEALTELVEAGKLRVHLQQVFPLEKLAEAHEVLAAGGVQGKLAITV
ncbi:NADP-dependent oxidoreductase [Streptomyces sp. Ag109_G2-15]|uniref:NADP-dependent oxidoreductase n=1 Tax=Streptomyces sp. Ag109_G2-15 TaxID=1938850 RepID=UPI000BD66C1A|nr:NADP-dependent oxidoreductase [Streptomyces sp. Ag109_G2-15]SOD91396.1 NADPH:quinone reductase [Streptomyces sp. Ag109_G2-15]